MRTAPLRLLLSLCRVPTTRRVEELELCERVTVDWRLLPTVLVLRVVCETELVVRRADRRAVMPGR